MAFNSFERTPLQLGILLSTMVSAGAYAQNAEVAAKPATPAACVALLSNAERFLAMMRCLKFLTALNLYWFQSVKLRRIWNQRLLKN